VAEFVNDYDILINLSEPHSKPNLVGQMSIELDARE
jgi:hypothetical protein